MGEGMDSLFRGNDRRQRNDWEWIPVFTGMTYGEELTGQRMDISGVHLEQCLLSEYFLSKF